MDDLIKRVAAQHMAKMHVEPHVRRNALAMAEELADARKSLDKAEQFSRSLRMEPSLDWIPEMVKKIADEHRELSKTIDETLEYLKDGDMRSAAGHTLAMTASATPGLDSVLTPALAGKVRSLSDKVNRAVDAAEKNPSLVAKTFDVVIKDVYKTIHLFDSFLSRWVKEKHEISGMQRLEPMVVTLRETLRNLDRHYAMALSGDKYRTVDLLTQIGTEMATLVTAHRQLLDF